MDGEVPGAGCLPGRKQRLQWVQRLAFKWSSAQKKCGEHGPSPAGASQGPSWALGCRGWMELTPAILTPVPPLPAPDAHLQLLPFYFILGCYKNTAKKFSKREKPAKCYFLPPFPLRLPLLHVLYTISWRRRASFYMQPIKKMQTLEKNHYEKDLVPMTMEIMVPARNKGKVRGIRIGASEFQAHHFLEWMILWKGLNFSLAQLLLL